MNKPYELGGLPVHMAVAYKSGDGWKDTTDTDQHIYVWGVTMAKPYVGNSCPRIGRGRYIYAVSPELHYYRPLKESEYYQLKSFFDESPALQAEAQRIRDGLESGELKPIDNLGAFFVKLNHPNDGGERDAYKRLEIDLKNKVDPVTASVNTGGRL